MTRAGKIVRWSLAAVMMLLAAGCATSSTDTYDDGDVGRILRTEKATVISSREIDIAGNPSAVGPIVGGAAGAAGAGFGFRDGNAGLAAVIGGLLGAGAGYLIEKQTLSGEGFEYVVEMPDGKVVTLVQNKESDSVPIADGTPVIVQFGRDYVRIVEEPVALRGKSPATEPPSAGTPADSEGGTAEQEESETEIVEEETFREGPLTPPPVEDDEQVSL